MTKQQQQDATPTWAWATFLVVQVVFVGAAVAATSGRLKRIEPVVPALRDTPAHVQPLYDQPLVVSDQQLMEVLNKLRPRLRGEQPKINHVDHALRFWGLESEFADPQCLSGQEMRELLIDHSQFSAAWGEDAQPLLIDGPQGIAVRTQEGQATASHVDHTLATLAEIGTPINYPVRTARGVFTIRNMVQQTLANFSLNQLEYEWSTLVFALYLEPTRSFTSSEGQEITFDRLADRIMRQRLNAGVCMGNHRLHTLVMLLRVHEQTPILSEAGRGRIVDHLQDVTRRFVASQHADGYWTRQWPSASPPTEDGPESSLQDRILATGHVLEWWALAPEEILPPRETLVRGGQWLSKSVIELDDDKIRSYYTFLTHAGRALALWRGKFPHELADALPHQNPTPAEKPAENSA
jgi:hypothetical protein